MDADIYMFNPGLPPDQSGFEAEACSAAEPLSAKRIHEQLAAAGVTHFVTVPDTHQRTVMEVVVQNEKIRFITACTEDEAVCIAAGLYIGGARPIVSIQNTGVLASVNALRGIGVDGRLPLPLLVGQYGIDLSRPESMNDSTAVRLLEPSLNILGIPTVRLSEAQHLDDLGERIRQCWALDRPTAFVVVAPTKD